MTHSQRNRRRRRGRGGPRNKAFLAFMVLGIVVALAGLGGIGYIIHVANSAPPLASIDPKPIGQNTRVYAADGSSLGFIQADELRLPVRGDQIPQVLKDATVAIEDERFYQHKGVDYEGVIRAAITNVASRRTVQGGSTITMQLVRNLYITPERTYERKIREAKLAEELENEHSKEWILDKYLDTVPFGTVGGQSAIGARAAARIYFSKNVRDLTLREAALLAGLPQAPSNYSPTRAPEAAMTRRNEVLGKMAELGMITEERARRAMRRGLGLNVSSFFTRRREQYFFDYVKDQLFREYGAQTVRKGGMKVYTTIDLDKQRWAREAIANNLAGIGPSAAIVTINPKNGYIEAMASSASYSERKFNLAAQGHRQPGSAFKTFALLTALRRGVDPDGVSYVSKSPTYVDDPQYGKFEIKTYSGRGAGSMTLRRATIASDNSVYIQLAMDLGPDEVKKTAREMGIRSKLNGYPAETLGGLENGVSPLEMAGAYATMAAGGWHARPTAIKRIVFPDGHAEQGKSLPKRFRVKRNKVFSDGVAAKATEILEQNMTSGTGTRALIGCPAAGKTGTTDNNTDAWFVGFTPRLSTAVWVGYPDSRIYMNTLYFGGPVDGGTFPAAIWGEYMGNAIRNRCDDFPAPKEPFIASPFYGRYANSGGAAIGGEVYTPPAPVEPVTPAEPAPEPAPEPEATAPAEPDAPANPGAPESGGFDPTQYEAAPDATTAPG
ncbi:MAG TPA: transglycosylase domain-containing protein [Solirubrobacteraceae bacterium]|nr:transglycosylase domain-containing protein [Solirubrobacteraceae bacterium]